MNNKWHVWYLYYVKKIQIVSRSYDIALRLCGETGVYMTELYIPICRHLSSLHLYQWPWITTLLSYWHHSPYSVQACFFYFLVEVSYEWLVYVICNDIGLYTKEGLFLYCWLLCFCASGADCQFVVQCSNLVIICCS